MEDKTIKCVDCKDDFIFTEDEQNFYESKGFKPPKRCFDCRKDAREKRAREEREGGNW